MSLFLCFVRAPFKLALLNWMPLDKYWLRKKKKTTAFEISVCVIGQLFKPWEANPRSYATKNGSAYLSRHKEKNLTHCCSLREGNLAADKVLIEFRKAPLDSINTVYKVTWGSHLPICFWPLCKTFAKSHSVGPATYAPAVSGFFFSLHQAKFQEQRVNNI